MSWIRKSLGIGAYVVVLTGAFAVGTGGGMLNASPMLKTLISDAINPPDPKEVFQDDALTLLLLGCDEERLYAGDLRPDGTRGPATLKNGSNVSRKYGRADMILVARLDFAKNRITGVSIPRDVWVRYGNYGGQRSHKINAYHKLAPEDEADAVTQAVVEHVLPGVKIDRTIALNYDAFKAMVDRVGGVEVKVSKAMNYDDYAGNLHIHLEPGTHRLTGEQAMGYVRFRKDIESDFGRQDRQKQFLANFKGALMKNPTALPDVAELGVQVMNGNLDRREISALAMFAGKVPNTEIKMGMIPVKNGRRRSTLLVDNDKLPDVLKEFGLIESGATRTAEVVR